MTDILFLTQRIPWPPIKGEKIRPGQIMRHFAKTHRVFLGTLVDDPEDEKYIPVVSKQVHEAFFGRINRRFAYPRSLTGLVTGAPLSFKFYENAALRAWTNRVLDTIRPDIIFVCSSNMMPYVAQARHRPQKLVVDFADVDSEKWRAYATDASPLNSAIYRREWRKVLAAEKRIAADADIVTFVTREEKELFDRVAPGYSAKTREALSGVDSDYFSADPDIPNAIGRDLPSFVFTGTMDYPPNVQAVVWFATQVLPIIQEERSDARFYIVGNRPSPAVTALAKLPGVVVTGRVADVREYLAHCTASVAPLQIARGIQNKVLEAMAMSAAVVATNGATTGINAVPGKHLLNAETPAEFAAACLSLFHDPQRAADLGNSARSLIDEGWSWTARLDAFDQLIACPSPAALSVGAR